MTFWPLWDFSALPMSLFGPANVTFWPWGCFLPVAPSPANWKIKIKIESNLKGTIKINFNDTDNRRNTTQLVAKACWSIQTRDPITYRADLRGIPKQFEFAALASCQQTDWCYFYCQSLCKKSICIIDVLIIHKISRWQLVYTKDSNYPCDRK